MGYLPPRDVPKLERATLATWKIIQHSDLLAIDMQYFHKYPLDLIKIQLKVG